VCEVAFGSLAMAQEKAPGSTDEAASGGGVSFGIGDIAGLALPFTAPLVLAEKALQASGVMDANGISAGNLITAGILAGFLKLLGFAIMGINYILVVLGSALFTLGGFLIELGLKWNAGVIASPIVETGWVLVRNFTNLGFILAIIYISFVIMLRIETYEIKKVVAKLLLAAIFINFSLTIVGIFLNASDTVSNFFISKATGEISISGSSGFHEFAKNLSGITNVQSGSKSGADLLAAIENGVQPDLGVGYLAVLTRLVLVVVFVALSNIVLFLLAFMVFLRYFVLTALLIIAPAAWLCFAVPKLYPYFTKWWNVVLKWVFFLPVTSFFLYLAIVVVYNPSINSAPGSPSTIAAQVANDPDYFSDVTGSFEQFGQMVLSLALMITGLIVGEKLGVMGAAGTIGVAKSAQDWVVGAIKAAPGAIGGFGLRQALTSFQKKDEKGNVLSTFGQRLAVQASRFGLTGAAQTFDKYGAVDLKAPVDKQEKRFAAFQIPTLLLHAQNAAALNESEAAGLAKVLASKNLLNKVSNENIEELAKKSEKFGVAKEIYKVRPDLAPDVEKAMKAIGKSSQKAQLSPKVFENLEALASLSNKDLEVIFKDPDEEMVETIKRGANATPIVRSRRVMTEQFRIRQFLEQGIPAQGGEEA